MNRDALREAYRECERMAREHYENFPVASLLLPARMRPHVAAVYAFGRVADDIADEGSRPAGERQSLLDGWLARLRDAVREGEPQDTAAFGPSDLRTSPALSERSESKGTFGPLGDAIFLALGNTIRECSLPVSLFEDLASAFRQDTEKRRYESFDEVLDYCRRSANPVGRLVLGIAGNRDEAAHLASDCVCTALQLVNFWQDLERDWAKGRLYVPQDEMCAAGAREADLDRRDFTAAWAKVMSSLAARTRDLFDRGRPVAGAAGGRLGFELRLTWLGGCRILDLLERQRFNVFGRRPALGKRDVPLLLWRAMTWRIQQ